MSTSSASSAGTLQSQAKGESGQDFAAEMVITGVAAVTARGIMPLITKALKEKN